MLCAACVPLRTRVAHSHASCTGHTPFGVPSLLPRPSCDLGFTSAAAIAIGLSQLQYFLGFKIPKSQYITDTLTHVFTNLHNTQPAELAFGLGWWFMLWGSRKLAIQ